MEMSVEQVVLAISTVAGVITSLFYSRRAKKAEVQAKEAEVKAKEAEVRAKEIESAAALIENADKMIELVKKANKEAAEVQNNLIKVLKSENEKFKRTADRLEKAFKLIANCVYRDMCPVRDELQKHEADPTDERHKGSRDDPGSGKGHNDHHPGG